MASQGPNSPATVIDDSSHGTQVWSNPGNATASDDARAIATGVNNQISHYLKATDFSFSIPNDATIDGIIVEIEGHRASSIIARDTTVKLVKAGAVVGDNRATASWPSSGGADITRSFGSSSDLWGESWEPADINDSDFGMVFAVALDPLSDGDPTEFRTDHLQITVHYSLGAQTISVSSITSAAAFGSPTISPGVAILSPSGVTSAEAFGSPTLLPGAVTLIPVGITSGEQLGTAQLNLSITANNIASAEMFGSPQIAVGGLSLFPDAIGSAETFGSLTIATGAVIIATTTMASAESVSSPTIARGAVSITLAGIASAEQFGSPQLNLALFISSVESAEAFNQPTLQPGAVALSVTGIASVEAFGQPIIHPGVVIFSPSSMSSVEAFGLHQINLTIVSASIGSEEAFGSPTLSTGGVFVVPQTIASTESITSPFIQADTLLLIDGIASAEAFGSAQINLAIAPTGIASVESVNGVQINLTISLTGIASGEVVNAVILSGRVPSAIFRAKVISHTFEAKEQPRTLIGRNQ